MRLQARSTLFPYTTLFRSSLELDKLIPRGQERVGVLLPNVAGTPVVLMALWKLGKTPALLNFHNAIKTDRKSTRLNSSHSQISYAVFCLKKKNSLPLKIIT